LFVATFKTVQVLGIRGQEKLKTGLVEAIANLYLQSIYVTG